MPSPRPRCAAFLLFLGPLPSSSQIPSSLHFSVSSDLQPFSQRIQSPSGKGSGLARRARGEAAGLGLCRDGEDVSYPKAALQSLPQAGIPGLRPRCRDKSCLTYRGLWAAVHRAWPLVSRTKVPQGLQLLDLNPGLCCAPALSPCPQPRSCLPNVRLSPLATPLHQGCPAGAMWDLAPSRMQGQLSSGCFSSTFLYSPEALPQETGKRQRSSIFDLHT